MINCSISKEQQLKFAGEYVAPLLKRVIESDEPLDVEKHMKEVYKKVMDASQNNKARALDYARLVPLWIDIYASNKIDVKKALRKQDFDWNKFNDIIDSITEESDGLKNTQAIVAPTRNPKEDMEDANDDSDEDVEEEDPDETPPEEEEPPLPSSGESVFRKIVKAISEFMDKAFTAFAPTALATTGLEASKSENRNVPFDDDRKMRYMAQRWVLSELKNQRAAQNDSSKMDFYGYGGVFLTAMSVKQLEGELGNDYDASQDPNQTGVFLVLTKENGEMFRFNEQGLPVLASEGGRIAYYPLRKTNHLFDNKGEYKGNSALSQVDKYRISSAKKTAKVTEKEATDNYVAEMKTINDLRRKILENKDENTVEFIVNGGSMGFIDKDFRKFRTRLKDTNETFEEFKVAERQDLSLGLGMKLGTAYFFPEGTYGEPLELERPTIGPNLSFNNREEYGNVDFFLNLIFGNITDSVTGSPLSYLERKKYLNIFLDQKREHFTIAEMKEGEPSNLLGHKIILNNSTLPLNTEQEVEEAKQKIKDYLTKLSFQRTIERSELGNRRPIIQVEGQDPLVGAKPGDVIQMARSGKLWLVDQAKLNIDINLIKKGPNATFDMPILEEQEDGSFSLSTEKQSYRDFLTDNFYSSAEVNAEGKFVKLNSYFTFELSKRDNKGEAELYPEEVEEMESVEEEEEATPSNSIPSSEIDNEEDYDDDDFDEDASQQDGLNALNKIKPVKDKEKAATKKQIAEAKEWYDNLKWKDPETGKDIYMKDIFPYRRIFRAANLEDSNSVATWAMSGITLFKGSDYSDLYHEAWHGFSQAFMSIKEKKELYAEVGKKKGSFTTFTGKKVLFSEASPLEIEEWLAEEFRNYMLNGQKETKGEPKKNNIFKRIWNFLKLLFNEGTSEYSIMLDETSDKKIKEIFDTLRVGSGIYKYNFSAENVMFGDLQSGVLRLEDRPGVSGLNNEDTQLLMETIDSLFTEYIDSINSGLTIPEQKQLQELESRFANNGQYYKTLKDEEVKATLEADKKMLAKLKSKRNYKATSQIVTNDKFRLAAYNNVYGRLKKIRKNYKELYDNETDTVKKEEIARDLELLNFAIAEFGQRSEDKKLLSIKDQLPKAGEKIRGVIAHHMFKSKLFSDAEYLDFENLDETDTFLKGREGYNRSGTENSLKELAKNEILFLLKGVHATNPDGTVKRNRLGVPVLAEFQATWNRTARALQNSSSIDDMYNRLLTEAKGWDPAKQLLKRLGPLYDENISKSENDLWTNFWQAFNKTRVPLIQLTVSRSQGADGTTYTSTVGEAFNADYAIGKRWDNEFRATQPGESKFIKIDKSGPYLDIEAVLEAFPENSIERDAFDFYKAIGFNLTDVQEIRDEIANNKARFGATFFRDALVKLKDKKNRKGKVVKVRSIMQITEQLSNRFKALQILEARYSDAISNFMVSNAEGNSQYEHSLNNTMTTMVNDINNADNYLDLISQPHMSYLDIREFLDDGSPNPDYNPFAEASIWLKSIFELDLPQNHPSFGTRKTSETGDLIFLRLTNLSGAILKDKKVKTKDDSSSNQIFDEGEKKGISSAGADEFTKAILDLHLAHAGYPELMRHADKGTSYSIVVDGADLGNQSKKHYVPGYLFTNKTKSTYEKQTFNAVKPHLIAEMKRMRILRNLKPDQYDFKYLEQGQDFSIFDDVLNPKVRKALEKIVAGNKDIAEALNEQSTHQMLYDNLVDYFEKQYNKTKKIYAEIDFATSTIVEQVMSEAKEAGITLTYSDAKDSLIRSYVHNNWIHNVESLAIVYGDLALYNHVKEEFHKRNAGAGSTGTIYRTDSAMQRYINGRLANTSYAAKHRERLGIAKEDLGTYNGTMDTAVVRDQQVKSAYYDSYLLALGASADAYGDMTEADAQGLITMDAYRELKTAEGDWSDSQEELYQKIVKGERVTPTDVKEFFPVIKAQYWGPLKHANALNLMGFHKYSLMPLIPTVIKNKNAEKLHDKMLKEGIKYLTFESGSKVSTISKESGADALYRDDSRTLNLEDKFTKNTIYLKFLKNQLAIAPKSKGKVIFSTQLRKLIIDGLMEGGVPTDFMPDEKDINIRINAWNKVQDKESESERYRLLKRYEKNIEKLTQFQKDKLLKEMNWSSEIVKGKEVLKGDPKELLRFIKRELSRQDLGQHELDFISDEVDPKTGKLKVDLSLSLSVEQIEKSLNALMVKRLINQKVNGEGLIQVASTLFEEMNGAEGYNYTNPTEQDLKEHGSNDLPTYELEYDEDGNPIRTKAMKVKVALQGQFKNLLDLIHPDGERIGTLDRLNKLIRDDAWLDTAGKRYREMITMTGVRIPVQGLNSMEFMEVYEFLPEEAGSIIIPPTEIVAKSGADYDVDKMTVMMPNIRKAKKQNGEIVQEAAMWNYTQKELDEAYDFYVEQKKKIARGGMDIKTAEALDEFLGGFGGLFGSSEEMEEELFQMLIEEGKVEKKEEFTKRMLNDKAIQNDLIGNIRDILALPSNYDTFIRPNGTEIVDGIAADLADKVMDYDPLDVNYGEKRFITKDGKKKYIISPTRALEIQYNLYKHSSNAVGKDTLGLGAVDNTYNALFNRIGMYMNPTAGITTKEYNRIRDKEAQGKKLTAKEKRGKREYYRQKLFLPHNKRMVGEEEAISLSHIYDVNGEHKISDVINQMMNGWVDIAKDAWIFNIQGNKEVSPILLFMIQSGVPVKDAIYLASNPLVRNYVKEQKLAKSTFAQPLGKAPENAAFYRISAKEAMLTNPKYGFNFSSSDLRTNSGASLVKATIRNSAMLRITDSVLNDEGYFDQGELYNSIINESEARKKGEAYEYTEFDKAAFLHFLEIEEMAMPIRDIKMKMNVDTSKDGNLFEAQNRIKMIEELRKDQRIPMKAIDRLITDSPIGSFFIQPFQIELLGNVFPLRNNEEINTYLEDFTNNFDNKRIIDLLAEDKETFVTNFKNDLPLYLYQNAIRGVRLNDLKSYNGFSIKKGTLKNVPNLEFGAYVQDDILYIDPQTINNDFINRNWTKSKQGLARVSNAAFNSIEEYYKFILERETLRAQYTPTSLADNIEFKANLKRINATYNQSENESVQAFKERKVRVAYEEWLRDTALDRSFNHWKMFKSNNTYADRYYRILEAYPELRAHFSILSNISLQHSESSGYTNLALNDSKLDADQIDVAHENLLDLSNRTKLQQILKDKSPKEIEQIAALFKQIPHVAFLQSGFNTKSKYSLTRIVDQKPITRILEKSVKGLMKNLDRRAYVRKKNKMSIQDQLKKSPPAILTDYMHAFIQANRSPSSRIRGKNLFTGIQIESNGKFKHKLNTSSEIIPYSDKYKVGDVVKYTKTINEKKIEGVYKIVGEQEETITNSRNESAVVKKFKAVLITDDLPLQAPISTDVDSETQVETYTGSMPGTNLNELVESNPDKIFVYNESSSSERPGTAQNDGRLHRKSANVFGIPTRAAYNDAGGTERASVVRDKDGQIDPDVKAEIDEAIAQLVEDSRGKTIVWNKKGYGQDMIEKGRDGKMYAPKTFLYLSEQLLENFGYINPSITDYKSGRDIVQEKQKVSDIKIKEQSDQAVRDFINHCMAG